MSLEDSANPIVTPDVVAETPAVVPPAQPASLLGDAQGEAPVVETETPVEPANDEAPKEEAEPEGAPEAYADFEVPEGFELQPEITDDFRVVAKELNLPQAAAQKVIDLGTRLTKSVIDAQAKAFVDARAEWVTASKADAEFGGDKLNQSLTYAAKFRDAYATPELKTLLNESGMGDHPEVVRLFARAGKAISEAAFVAPGSKAPERIPGQIAYTHPTSKPKS